MSQEFRNKTICILLEKFLQEHTLDELTVEKIGMIRFLSNKITEGSEANESKNPQIDLDDPISKYGINNRSFYWKNIITVRNLLQLSDYELKRMSGVGIVTYRRVKQFLAMYNLKLKGQ